MMLKKSRAFFFGWAASFLAQSLVECLQQAPIAKITTIKSASSAIHMIMTDSSSSPFSWINAVAPSLMAASSLPITTPSFATNGASSSLMMCSQQQQQQQLMVSIRSDKTSSNENDVFTPSSSIYKTWKQDKVARIVDANTVKFEKLGQFSLAAMQMPSAASANFQFPDCFDKSPSYKLRQLLPKGTVVRIQVVSSSSSSSASTNTALIVRESDGVLVNAALVQAGYGRVKEKSAQKAEVFVPDLTSSLMALQQWAQTRHLGMYLLCESTSQETNDGTTTSSSSSSFTEAVFEPLVSEASSVVPANPGDRRNCADFETYEEALKYYETFFPYFGDVARLDRDKDGVPCPGLPHTDNPELYRMKVPTAQKGK